MTAAGLADLVRRLRHPSLTDKAVFACYDEAADAIEALEAALRLACFDTGFDVDEAVEHYTRAARRTRVGEP